MKNVGYIYVLINPSMPNLCKVGKTTREPNDRVREISSATGVPQSFIEIYSERVSNPDEAEKAVHYKLEACGFRVSANREFFQGSVSEIIKITSKILEKYKNENDSFDTENNEDEDDIFSIDLNDDQQQKEEEALDLLRLANDYRDGTDEILKDPVRALKLYEQAAAIKSYAGAIAACCAGDFYSDGFSENGSIIKINKQKAMELYKKSAQWGYHGGFQGMYLLFMSARQYRAAAKAITRQFELILSDNEVDYESLIIKVGANISHSIVINQVESIFSDEVLFNFSEDLIGFMRGFNIDDYIDDLKSRATLDYFSIGCVTIGIFWINEAFNKTDRQSRFMSCKKLEKDLDI
ncbi:MAG: hypothetical protein RLZZ612_328 [Pseudomonadota bacterium]|jgi:hypothetical protein